MFSKSLISALLVFGLHSLTASAVPLIDNSDSFSSVKLFEALNRIYESRRVLIPVTVAVVDSGIKPGHPMFSMKFQIKETERFDGNDTDLNGLTDDVVGYDFVTQSGFMKDPDGHGTHVSGIIAQVNSRAKILPIRVLDDNGSGQPANIARAISYAVERGARVINLSLGAADVLAQTGSVYEASMKYARENGVLILAAAGNDFGSNNDETAYFPANVWDDNVMSICSNSLTGALSEFSNYGNWRVHLCAPGENILSANHRSNSFMHKYFPAGGFVENIYQSGTSQATPIVAAAASMLFGLAPWLQPYEVRDLLMNTVQTSSELAGKSQTGGILNIDGAVEALIKRLDTMEGKK